MSKPHLPDPSQLAVSADAQAMIARARAEGIETVWDRLRAQEPQCGYCQLGLSCRNCTMGPCRIDPFGEGPQKGVCGANADIIVARNLGRTIAAGAAAHSDHGRDILEVFAATAEGKTTGYEIRDETKLAALAAELGVAVEGRDKRAIAHDVAEAMLEDFGTRKESLSMLGRVPEPRLGLWGKLGVYAARHRPRERRDAAPHPHGRGQRLGEHSAARAAHEPVRRVGRLDDRNRTVRRAVRRHAEATGLAGQPGRPARGLREHRPARAQPHAVAR